MYNHKTCEYLHMNQYTVFQMHTIQIKQIRFYLFACGIFWVLHAFAYFAVIGQHHSEAFLHPQKVYFSKKKS